MEDVKKEKEQLIHIIDGGNIKENRPISVKTERYEDCLDPAKCAHCSEVKINKISSKDDAVESSFKKGDKVQFTLERAVRLELDTIHDLGLGDPINDIYQVVSVSEGVKYDPETGRPTKPLCIAEGFLNLTLIGSDNGRIFSGVDPKYVEKVEDNPRYIEKITERRPSKDEYYLGIAKQVATRSTCLRRKYGAVIVHNDVIISTGYNGSPRGERNCSDRGYCLRQIIGAQHNDGNYDLCRSVHGEQNAIINAARQGSSILGGTLYLYGYDCMEGKVINAEPCPICARMINNAGIARVVASKG